jgi:hypothetical protein
VIQHHQRAVVFSDTLLGELAFTIGVMLSANHPKKHMTTQLNTLHSMRAEEERDEPELEDKGGLAPIHLGLESTFVKCLAQRTDCFSSRASKSNKTCSALQVHSISKVFSVLRFGP